MVGKDSDDNKREKVLYNILVRTKERVVLKSIWINKPRKNSHIYVKESYIWSILVRTEERVVLRPIWINKPYKNYQIYIF